MIDFVGTPQSVRIALCIAIEIMHFHTAQTCFFRIHGVQLNNLACI